ncbi:MAG: DUF2924 domain-containing protein [Bryobacteraceae bacterium]|nr:DUF2924 domain-containing protein [Bryobacteraceae bacterium]
MPDHDAPLDKAIRDAGAIPGEVLPRLIFPDPPGFSVDPAVTETQIGEEIEALRHRTTAELKQKHRAVFGEESRRNHKQFLFRRIARRIQANAWDGPPNGPGASSIGFQLDTAGVARTTEVPLVYSG